MNVTEAKKILEEQKDFLRERFHVMDVGIFGSFVKGEETALSDIDILVTFERGHKDFFNYMRMKKIFLPVIMTYLLLPGKIAGLPTPSAPRPSGPGACIPVFS